MLSVTTKPILLSVFKLNVIVSSVVFPNVIMLCFFTLNVIMMDVVMLDVAMLNVMVPILFTCLLTLSKLDHFIIAKNPSQLRNDLAYKIVDQIYFKYFKRLTFGFQIFFKIKLVRTCNPCWRNGASSLEN